MPERGGNSRLEAMQGRSAKRAKVDETDPGLSMLTHIPNTSEGGEVKGEKGT